MFALFNKKRNDKGTWHKVSDLRAGLEIAVPVKQGQTLPDDVFWDEIVSITPVGKEQVYDIEVDGTHNFVGNDIFAHNTYVLKSGALTANAPDDVLTADHTGVDLAKLATHTLADVQDLAAEFVVEDTKLVSLETRVTALESGAVGSQTSSTTGSLTSSLASALNSFGVLIQKGIAQFNTLVFRQLVASKDADGTSSAGSISVLAGNTVAQVNNSLVLPSTKVFITFNSQITGSWWVSDKANGSFRVVLSESQAGDVSFDYFLVQTEGQLATSSPMTDGSLGSLTSGASKDTEAPMITLLGDNPVHLSIGGTFVEPGVRVSDDSDAIIPIVTYINGIQQEANASTIDTSSQITYVITYEAKDAAGNSATARRSVIVGADGSLGSQTSNADSGSLTSSAPVDVTAPVVTLNGEAAMQLVIGDTFTDPGATANDDVDGALELVVTGEVDTATDGLYTLTYTATDKTGNSASVSRVITVVATP